MVRANDQLKNDVFWLAQEGKFLELSVICDSNKAAYPKRFAIGYAIKEAIEDLLATAQDHDGGGNHFKAARLVQIFYGLSSQKPFWGGPHAEAINLSEAAQAVIDEWRKEGAGSCLEQNKMYVINLLGLMMEAAEGAAEARDELAGIVRNMHDSGIPILPQDRKRSEKLLGISIGQKPSFSLDCLERLTV